MAVSINHLEIERTREMSPSKNLEGDSQALRDSIHEQLTACGRLSQNDFVTSSVKGKAYAKLGLQFDHSMGFIELAQFCYARAIELLSPEDPILPTVLIARGAIYGDVGDIAEAARDLSKAIELFKSLRYDDQADFAADLLCKLSASPGRER